jgi:hypothetical protein
MGTFSTVNGKIDNINGELKKLALWFKANKLVLNVSKTKFMIFRTRNKTVNLNGKTIYIDFNENNDNVDQNKIATLERVPT